MKTLIVYASMHGCAKKSAEKLAEQLSPDVHIVDIKRKRPKGLDEYDRIIVGGSIHAGKIQRKIKSFCQKNEALLRQKKLGLYLCCMEQGEKAEQQFRDAYAESLRSHAAAIGLFGGEFDFDRMGIFTRAIIKRIAKTEESVSRISYAAIADFAAQMSE
ncbi:flavodoxin [candidate division KSB1 bacterium]|nr:MAG: flavodoxin [candidate division KSB1 bacterium]